MATAPTATRNPRGEFALAADIAETLGTHANDMTFYRIVSEPDQFRSRNLRLEDALALSARLPGSRIETEVAP